MAFDYDDINPLNDAFIANYPGNERSHREAVLDSVNVDHYAEAGPSTPSQDGHHRQASLPPLVGDPTGVGDAGFIYTKSIGGITELFYKGRYPDRCAAHR